MKPDRVDLASTRFYAILDASYVARSAWRATCRQLIEGGADLVQIRAKNVAPADREALLREVLPLFRPVGPTGGLEPILIINDDVDLCARFPGTGLHVGQDDMPPVEARARIGAGRVLGLSTHSRDQATKAEELPRGVIDYFCVGPVFSTPTKPDYVPVGLKLVEEVRSRSPRLPWFAIGGIKRSNLAQVLAAGAKRVVVVSEVLLERDPAGVIRDYLGHLPAGT